MWRERWIRRGSESKWDLWSPRQYNPRELPGVFELFFRDGVKAVQRISNYNAICFHAQDGDAMILQGIEAHHGYDQAGSWHFGGILETAVLGDYPVGSVSLL